MKNKTIVTGILVVSFLIVFAMVPQVTSAGTDTSLSDVLDAGKITVGIEAAYPPFEQKSGDVIEGFDPSIMEFIADDMDIDIEWMDVAWTTIFTSLATGNYDCVISAVTITPDRMASMDFTRWYYFSIQAAIVTVENPKNITVVDDVNNSSIKVGIQSDTTSQWYLEDEEYAADMVGFATITLAMAALESGTVDVVLGDLATVVSAGNAINATGFTVVDKFSPEAFGIAVQKGSTALADRMNTAIDKLLGSDPYNPVFSATYNATHEEWMNATVAVDLAELKLTLDSLVLDEEKSTISGASIFSLIAIIPITTLGIIRKYKKRTE